MIDNFVFKESTMEKWNLRLLICYWIKCLNKYKERGISSPSSSAKVKISRGRPNFIITSFSIAHFIFSIRFLGIHLEGVSQLNPTKIDRYFTQSKNHQEVTDLREHLCTNLYLPDDALIVRNIYG